MFLKISDLLSREVTGGSVFLIIVLVILFLLFVFGFYLLMKACFRYEKASGTPAFSLIKALIIAAAPIIYGAANLVGFDEYIPVKLVAIACIICCIIVSVWDIKSYGLFIGIMFSILHIGFGALASLAALSLVFLAVFLVLFFFFGGTLTPPGASGGSNAPEYVRDRKSGMLYHVTSGANGNLYIEDNGRSCLLRADPDFDGVYFDDAGNEYYV